MNNSELYLYQKSYLRKYLDTKERELGLLANYATATHIYDKYQNFPILHFLGDFQTAKNRRLELLDPICLNPTIVTNSTLPSLFRTTDEYKGTIMLDEADYILGFNEIKNFLLSGYQKGVKITRMVPDNKHEKGYRPVDFEIFGPKIIVTREGSDLPPYNRTKS
ncbi:MAG: hypothetical protein GTO02_20100 [Candidatus Dadabacteria bacterium]|nr:hypothetical protein [Candidatus Dadabacteria bacterium]